MASIQIILLEIARPPKGIILESTWSMVLKYSFIAFSVKYTNSPVDIHLLSIVYLKETFYLTIILTLLDKQSLVYFLVSKSVIIRLLKVFPRSWLLFD